MSDKITQEELDLIAKFLENNEVTELEDGYAEDAIELGKFRSAATKEDIYRKSIGTAEGFARYMEDKGGA